jgi:transposase
VISNTEEAEILRLSTAEGWTVGELSSHFERHHSVVERVIKEKQENILVEKTKLRYSMLNAYQFFIEEMLDKYPKISASRIYQMLCSRGYPGRSVELVRRRVRELRKAKIKEAFLRITTLPGEEAQVDWAMFGKVEVGKTIRPLVAFVMTLSYSRAMFVKFFFSMGMREFEQGFVDGFNYFGGVPKRILIDNLRCGVKSRVDSFVSYNDEFLSLCKHFCFEPRAVGVRKGNEKGKVERSIRYLRSNFYDGREWSCLANLNKEALEWCETFCMDRHWPGDMDKTVRESFLHEKKLFLAIPEQSWTPVSRIATTVGKYPFIRFDLNNYSVPAEYAQKSVEVVATDDKVVVNHKGLQIAEHIRSYDKALWIEDAAHFIDILLKKRKAHRQSELSRLSSIIPKVMDFAGKLADNGGNLGGIVSSISKMMNEHGAPALKDAIDIAMTDDFATLRKLHLILAKSNKKTDYSNIIPIEVSEKYRGLSVNHHQTSHYDALGGVRK